MVRRILLATSAAALLAIPGAAAVAQPTTNVPGLSLLFVEPFGIGTVSSFFDVFIRLSNDGPDDFTFDGGTPNAFGLAPGFPFPTEGTIQSGPSAGTRANFVGDYTDAFLNNSFECSGSFTLGCGPGAYTFDFNYAAPSLIGLTSLTLAAGTSTDFLFGTFTPTGGSAPPGLYTFYNAAAIIGFRGVDANGDPVLEYVKLADTCEAGEASCAFTRFVRPGATSVTPEPATFALFATGLVAMAAFGRRRRKSIQ